MLSLRKPAMVILWAAVAAAFWGGSSALSEEFPTRAITLIVQFAPGTSTDIVARKLADEVSKTLGQPVVCVNKAGGGGTVGVAEMLRTQPDGYTIGCVNMPVLAIIPHMQEVPYDPLKDIAHICVVQPYEYGLYVKADAPWNTIKDLVSYIKSHPGEVVFGSIGVGTTNHLIMARIAKQENLKFKHVPYKGDGELIPAMIGGHVHAAVGSPSAVVPQVKAGNLKLLVVTSKDRWSYLPEVPTLLESGYPFHQSSYFLFPRLRERAGNRANKLSGGEQQMLAVGRALMTSPDLLLMDEPTEGLAPLIVREVGRIIGELRREGLSILLVEQNLPFALSLADRVHVLSGVQIVHSSTPAEHAANDEVKSRYLGV